MNNVNSKNCFRKILSATQQEQINSAKFRKSIDSRMSTPIKEYSLFERNYTKDIFQK